MHERLAWLSSPDTAMAAVVFTNVWRGIPFFAIMLLAGLQSVPDELYEAAHVDGAGVLARFWHITLPLLRPIIVVATATRIIWTFNYADLIFVMTGGGPANATQITSTYTLAAGLFEPRLRLRRRALGGPPRGDAGVHLRSTCASPRASRKPNEHAAAPRRILPSDCWPAPWSGSGLCC